MSLKTLYEKGTYYALNFLSYEETCFSKMIADPWPSNFNIDLEQLALICQHQIDTPYFETFEWLREFKNTIARNEVRELIEYWIKNNHFIFSNASKNWQPDITGYRVWNWISMFDFYGVSAHEEFKKNIKKSLFQQFKYLQKVWGNIKDPITKFRALKGLFAYYFITNRKMTFLIKELEILLDQMFFEDGGHQSRNSGLQLMFLRDLIDIRSVLSNMSHLDISFLHKKISQTASIVRLFRHGDGTIARFNGEITNPEDLFIPNRFSAALIDMCLSLSDIGRRPPTNAEVMGYMRFVNKSSVFLMATKLSKPLSNQDTSLGLFNFEWSFDRQCIIERCEVFIENEDGAFLMPQKDPLVQRTTNDEFHFINGEYKDELFSYTRQIHITNDKVQVKGEEYLTLHQPGYLAIRFILAKEVEVVPVSKSSKNIFLKIQGTRKKIMTLNFTASGCQDMFYQESHHGEPHAIILMACVGENRGALVKWSIED